MYDGGARPLPAAQIYASGSHTWRWRRPLAREQEHGAGAGLGWTPASVAHQFGGIED